MIYNCYYDRLPESYAPSIAEIVHVIDVIDHGSIDGWTTVVFDGDEKDADRVHDHFGYSGNVYVYLEGECPNG